MKCFFLFLEDLRTDEKEEMMKKKMKMMMKEKKKKKKKKNEKKTLQIRAISRFHLLFLFFFFV